MVTLPLLLNELTDHILMQYPCDTPYAKYRGIYLAEDGIDCEPGMIYVGLPDQLARLLIRGNGAEGCAFLAAGISDRLQNAPRHGLALVVTDLSLATLYNTLSHAFLKSAEWRQLIAYEAEHGLGHLLQAVSGKIGFSVLLLSNTLKPLAQSVQDGDEEKLALEGPPDAAAGSKTPGRLLLHELLARLDEPGANDANCHLRKDGCLYVLTPVRRERTILGYLFACSGLRGGLVHNVLYLLSDTVAELMLSEMSEPESAESFQSLAAQFLSDQLADLDQLELRLQRLPNRPRRFMRGVVIRLVNDDGQLPPVYLQVMRKLYREVLSLFPRDNVALLDECVYIMTSDDGPDAPISLTENASFNALLEKYGAYAIVSNPSQRLRGVRVLFRQCFQVLPVAVVVRFKNEGDSRCLRFDRYSPYYIICLCEKSVRREMGVDDVLYLCHPAVLTLTRYDRAFNSNLRDTLFAFLMNDRSISETSRQLFMHRNTTIYKLNKIQELIGDDLSNPYTRHQLILSCMIIRYVEQYHHDRFDLPPLESSLLRK